MNKKGIFWIVTAGFVFVSVWRVFAQFLPSQISPPLADLSQLSKKDGTNAPILWIGEYDRFGGHVAVCRVLDNGCDSVVEDCGSDTHWDAYKYAIGGTNRMLLEAALRDLPKTDDRPFVGGSEIAVSFVISNQWQQRTYDRTNLPSEMRRLGEMLGFPVAWHVYTTNEIP